MSWKIVVSDALKETALLSRVATRELRPWFGDVGSCGEGRKSDNMTLWNTGSYLLVTLSH